MEEVIYVGSDHGGFELKKHVIEFLKAKGYSVVDVGPFSYDKDDDYPDYAQKLCENVARKGKGILICRSGHGMAVTANKFKGVYASVCWSPDAAARAKRDENLNVISLPADFIGPEDAERTVLAWLDTPFNGEERHMRRLGKVRGIEGQRAKHQR
ncbi:MAG: RpiB/LacA/LacB family sugar-phosphate isomerase [Candidatus Micrarchaeota archaeon]|nr:RpiB/LacA/LacB family sugar-phosphate isomerase [Candidatus Micrarchaeota archaeon]